MTAHRGSPAINEGRYLPQRCRAAAKLAPIVALFACALLVCALPAVFAVIVMMLMLAGSPVLFVESQSWRRPASWFGIAKAVAPGCGVVVLVLVTGKQPTGALAVAATFSFVPPLWVLPGTVRGTLPHGKVRATLGAARSPSAQTWALRAVTVLACGAAWIADGSGATWVFVTVAALAALGLWRDERRRGVR